MKLRNSILTYNAIAGVQKINGGILQKIKGKYTPFLYFFLQYVLLSSKIRTSMRAADR